MPEHSSESPPLPAKSSWPKAVTVLGLAAMFVGAALWTMKRMSELPGAAVDKGVAIVKEFGGNAASVAAAFLQGTVREEFLSHATALTGTSRFQFATLHQGEIFQREESGSAAWGLIPLPKVVVQAQAPVEYSYYLDFKEPWEFRKEGQSITVLAPPISANTPAVNVSALKFYTLEGSVWRDEGAVRERLRETLTVSLKRRARENAKLVREIGRQRLAEFVKTWLAEKFGDGRDYRVTVIFPDEQPLDVGEKTAP